MMPLMVQAFSLCIAIAAQLPVAAAFDVVVSVGAAHASTDVSSLTSVTMDICLAKQHFPFNDPTLLSLTSHLGGGSSILRIGGSDQNSFFYDMQSKKSLPFSAKKGGKCCKYAGSCHGCAKDCTMPAPYWKTITDFAEASGHRLMFGLVPDVKEATALLTHSAKEKMRISAYTFGNEDDTPTVTAGYPVLRKLLSDTSIFPAGTAPRLAGPDVALQRHRTIDEMLAGRDDTVLDKLAWVQDFTMSVGSSLDVVSWHTYDYHSSDIAMPDHTTVQLRPETARLWSTKYLDVARRLSHNVTSIAAKNAPHAEVWLTESDSICHQGVFGVTNAYLNSIWLVNRLGIMANANVSVMARQSLVGYNYSLLGNWPVEPIKPNPDYFTTVLFRRLFGDTVLATTAHTSAGALPATNATGGGARARAFGFCAGKGAALPAGAIAVALVNFDPDGSATFKFDRSLGTHNDYLLTPGVEPVVAGVAWSSRHMVLNGEALAMGADGSLPAALTGGGATAITGSTTLGALTVGFSVFPAAGAAECK